MDESSTAENNNTITPFLNPLSEQLKTEGNNLLKQGDAAGALTKYTAGIELCTEGEPVHILYSNRSAAALKMKNFEQAIMDGEKCLELLPKWSKGYVRLATALREAGKLEEANEIVKKGLALEPRNASLMALADKLSNKNETLDKLRGTWHGVVDEALGGYMQEFEFISDNQVRVKVLGTVVDAKYDLNIVENPPHLD